MKKLCITICALTLLSSCSTTSPKESASKKMNVIYILADDLGYGDLGTYGQEKIHTPKIDQMASEGMKFTQHYAGSTVCAPSRASLMTGKHTGHTKVRGNQEVKPEGQMPMDNKALTVGKLMQNAGYATGIFGKWGLGYPGSEATPTKVGFDEFYGYNCQREAHSYYPNHLWHNDEKVNLDANKNGRNQYAQDMIHEKAMEFIKEHQKEPFFAMLTYTLPHAELQVPKDSIFEMYDGKFNDTPYTGRGYSHQEQPRATFAAMVSRLDVYVGEVIDLLKKLGIAENTIVIFTSDNGPHQEGGAQPKFFNSGGKLKGIKRDLYEGGIRVPMVVWCPKTICANSETDHISAFWDVLPTLAELTHQPIPKDIDGISFLPTLLSENKNQKQHDYLYWEFHELGGRKALRKGDWKLITQPINGKTKTELYNLKKDIHEDHNVAEQYPEKTKELLDLMKNARSKSDIFNFGLN